MHLEMLSDSENSFAMAVDEYLNFKLYCKIDIIFQPVRDIIGTCYISFLVHPG